MRGYPNLVPGSLLFLSLGARGTPRDRKRRDPGYEVEDIPASTPGRPMKKIKQDARLIDSWRF